MKWGWLLSVKDCTSQVAWLPALQFSSNLFGCLNTVVYICCDRLIGIEASSFRTHLNFARGLHALAGNQVTQETQSLVPPPIDIKLEPLGKLLIEKRQCCSSTWSLQHMKIRSIYNFQDTACSCSAGLQLVFGKASDGSLCRQHAYIEVDQFEGRVAKLPYAWQFHLPSIAICIFRPCECAGSSLVETVPHRLATWEARLPTSEC